MRPHDFQLPINRMNHWTDFLYEHTPKSRPPGPPTRCNKCRRDYTTVYFRSINEWEVRCDKCRVSCLSEIKNPD